ncbi:S100P-binding protein-like isoform X2 [Oreochromis aureus]|uniref:S100P-binding protein n=1 Tax=Oreochromis aureus TaxID=47969 RepID=A0AAZ1X6L2_OREAU|nr:S100P-binding protein-like isoform X2 [Oreochromis aureus]XP_031583977.1 S100P-binding protein-like isoform X2 [Oreochromis aureus]
MAQRIHRIISCDQKADVHQLRRLSKPFINFKIEIINNGTNKRKLHESSPDDCYVTPLKKPFDPKALSPDLGCFVDCCSTPVKQESESPFSTLNPELTAKTQDVGSEIKETVSSQLFSKDAKYGPSTERGGGSLKKETKTQDVMRERVLNPSPTFDYDVDDILCLNPDSPLRFLEDEDGYMSHSCQIFQDGLFPVAGLNMVEETADGREDEVKKETCLSVKDVEEDKGYISLSFINDNKGAGLVNSKQLTTNSAKGDYHPETSSKPRLHEQTATSGCLTVKVDNLIPSSGEPPLEHVNNNCLESCKLEGVWDIGPPIFESSMCHSETDKLKAEQSCQVSEEVQESVTEPVQSTLKKEDTAVETSYEATIPLKVQVKSKVQNTNRSTPDSSVVSVPKMEVTKPIRALQPAKSASQRSMVFSSELQWEQEKELYVNSVVSHMYENPGVSNGVTSELRSLMSCVSAGVKSREWQHPSDLTRRNYWRHFGAAAPLITLDEWQAKNCLMHKRFDKIPKIFERSLCP